MGNQVFKVGRQTMFLFAPEEVVIIGVDTDDGENHPLYDARAFRPLDEATVRDIMKRGVKKPIAVRKDGNRAVVVDGRRRTLHAREANKRRKAAGLAPLKIRVLPPEKGNDGEMLETMIALNEHVELDSPINRAKKLRNLLAMGYTEEQAADAFKCSPATLKNYLSLLDLDASLQKAIEEGTMVASAAYELASKSRKEQKAVLDGLKANGKKGTIKNTRNAIGKTNAAPPHAMLRQIVAKGADSLDAKFLLGIRYALGMADFNEVPGLSKFLLTLER